MSAEDYNETQAVENAEVVAPESVLPIAKKSPLAITDAERQARIEQVMDLAAQGFGPYEIARKLGISGTTVYKDFARYGQQYRLAMKLQGKEGQLMVKIGRQYRLASEQLEYRRGKFVKAKEVAPLLQAANQTLAVEAKVLGLDRSGESSPATPFALTILVQGQQQPERVVIGPQTVEVDVPTKELLPAS